MSVPPTNSRCSSKWKNASLCARMSQSWAGSDTPMGFEQLENTQIQKSGPVPRRHHRLSQTAMFLMNKNDSLFCELHLRQKWHDSVLELHQRSPTVIPHNRKHPSCSCIIDIMMTITMLAKWNMTDNTSYPWVPMTRTIFRQSWKMAAGKGWENWLLETTGCLRSQFPHCPLLRHWWGCEGPSWSRSFRLSYFWRDKKGKKLASTNKKPLHQHFLQSLTSKCNEVSLVTKIVTK